MTTERDPEIGSILEEVEAAAENVLNPVVSAGGSAADAVSAIWDALDMGDGGGASGGGASGGGGSTDPWDPSPTLPDPDPAPTPEFEIPPELEAIINPVVDPDEPWRIN